MGQAASLMTRPIKKYNIEARAHKLIGRDKPMPAPPLKSTKILLEAARASNPDFMESHYKKDVELNDRLKNIFVQSRDSNNESEIDDDPNRPLPILTRSYNEFEYGFWEPEVAADGRCTLKTAMAFMADHLDDPIKHSAQEIAVKYKLESKDVENILTYYRVFKVVVPEGRPELAYMDRSQLGAGQNKE